MSLVIVGLGNTGKEYEKTRHNTGRAAVELLARQEGLDEFVFNKTANALVAKGAPGGKNVTLVLPETMMNASGRAVAAFVKNVKAAKDLVVIHDDLDLPLGTIKMVFARGSGGHKGVESIMRAIRTEQFARIRIGIAPLKNPASAPPSRGASGGRGKASAGKQAKKFGDEEKVIKHVIGKWKPAEETTVKKVLKKAAEAARLFVTDGIETATQFANTR